MLINVLISLSMATELKYLLQFFKCLTCSTFLIFQGDKDEKEKEEKKEEEKKE